jgi:uncharacterized protein YaaN involved in tellurite resistance
MIIANIKRRENIAEYILYMFQVEDLIRAYSFDIYRIESNVINKFDQPYPVKREMREWYSSLIYIMKSEELEERGHIPEIQFLLQNLESFHENLLRNPEERNYHELYKKAKSSIEALTSKSPGINETVTGICLNGLYGLLMLRLTKKTISAETTDSFEKISEMISLLSSKYLVFESGLKKN